MPAGRSAASQTRCPSRMGLQEQAIEPWKTSLTFGEGSFMNDIHFPAFAYSPPFVVGMCILWLACLAVLTIPTLRESARFSLFADWNSPMGRGFARSSTTRTVMLFAIVSADLVGTLPVAAGVVDFAVFTLAGFAVLSLVAFATQVFFNWPRFLAPKAMRNQPGVIAEWLHRGRTG